MYLVTVTNVCILIDPCGNRTAVERYMFAFVGYARSKKYVTVKHYAYFEVAALQKMPEKTRPPTYLCDVLLYH